MTRSPFARLLTVWPFGRDRDAERIAELRRRDGENCRRCRRPLRFDLPAGHDQGPRVEPIAPAGGADSGALAGLCLCHGRCNAETGDSTAAVRERLQARTEQTARKRKVRRAA